MEELGHAAIVEASRADLGPDAGTLRGPDAGDGAGGVVSAQRRANVGDGGAGIVRIAAQDPGFDVDPALVSQHGAGRVRPFDLGGTGILPPMVVELSQCRPGRRVRVIQQMPQRDRSWTNVVEGVVVRGGQSKTGSWYAHARDDQLWLDRLELRLDDGELVTLNLDRYSVVEPLDEGPAAA